MCSCEVCNGGGGVGSDEGKWRKRGRKGNQGEGKRRKVREKGYQKEEQEKGKGESR